MNGRRKGRMARQLVYYCLRRLSIILFWAAGMKTAALILDRVVDLTDILTFAGIAFGGELLMLLCKRMLAKPSDTNENSYDGCDDQ